MYLPVVVLYQDPELPLRIVGNTIVVFDVGMATLALLVAQKSPPGDDCPTASHMPGVACQR